MIIGRKTLSVGIQKNDFGQHDAFRNGQFGHGPNFRWYVHAADITHVPTNEIPRACFRICSSAARFRPEWCVFPLCLLWIRAATTIVLVSASFRFESFQQHFELDCVLFHIGDVFGHFAATIIFRDNRGLNRPLPTIGAHLINQTHARRCCHFW